MELEFSAKTETGIVRDHNEDSYAVIPELRLFAACDGMGGHAAGDYASARAVETLALIKQRYSRELFEKLESRYRNMPESGRRLAVQTMLINRRLFRLAVMYPKLRGMGTTLTAAMFDEGYVNIVNVGDSRTYVYRNSKLSLLTKDHSWVEEMRQDGEIGEQEMDDFKAKNVITRALGTNPTVKIDYKSVLTNKDDIFLLCSDGLCGEISDSEIESIIRNGKGNLDEISGSLIEAARQAGGSDNVTAVLIRVKTSQPAPENIQPDELISVDEEKSVVDILDDHINEYFPPAKTEVPAGVEKEKKKLYHNPLFNTAAILFLLLSAAALFTAPGRVTGIPSTAEAPGSSIGDLLIRTDPPGARVIIQRSEGNFSDEMLAPADFLALEAGHYTVIVEKDGYEKEIIRVYLRKGIQESRKVVLSPQQQLYITIGASPGFDPSEVVYIDNEPFMYYGRPLTVSRIGYAGRKISVLKNRSHVIRIGEQAMVIRSGETRNVIKIIVENGNISVEE